MSVNKVILIGNLGTDPDIKVFDSGDKIVTISLATSEKWTDKQTGEKRENTEWHRVVFNNRLAEIAEQYLRKGSKVYVEGSIKTRKWQDPKTGQDRYSTEIRANSLQMLSSKNEQGYQGQNSDQGYQPTYPQGQGYQSQQPPRKIGGGFKEMEASGKAPKTVSDDDMPF